MKGYRNLSDRLWDIPIAMKLKQDNYIMPPIYLMIYIATMKKPTMKLATITKVKKRYPPDYSHIPYTI